MVLGRFKDTYFRSTSLLNSAIYRPNKAFQRSLLINRAFARQLIFCDPIVTRTFEGKTVARRLAKAKITLESVKAAARKAKAGAEYDLADPQCPGLQLRVRGGEVTWAVRARLFGKQRRWVVGNAETKPDVARERAGELKSWCRRGQNPEKLVTQFSTGISIAYQVRGAGERPPPSWPWEKAIGQVFGTHSGFPLNEHLRRLWPYTGRPAHLGSEETTFHGAGTQALCRPRRRRHQSRRDRRVRHGGLQQEAPSWRTHEKRAR